MFSISELLNNQNKKNNICITLGFITSTVIICVVQGRKIRRYAVFLSFLVNKRNRDIQKKIAENVPLFSIFNKENKNT